MDSPHLCQLVLFRNVLISARCPDPSLPVDHVLQAAVRLRNGSKLSLAHAFFFMSMNWYLMPRSLKKRSAFFVSLHFLCQKSGCSFESPAILFHTSPALHSLLPDHLMLQSCLRPLRHGDLFLLVPILSCLFKLFVGHNAISILLKFTLLFQKNLIKPCSVYPFKLLCQIFAF